MYCINCGSQNVDVTSQQNQKVFLERGEHTDGKFEEELEAVVLECKDCNQEMVQI
ncbi:hypothetical protein [Vibrio coralliilyticus]|uniref:hypothetical protein n=1 Tax=Vibrio coralliilyticus TaxID=190893 RepID=UPI00148C0496|nr:hypothetical protein [Vibrio coralliilyticus]